MILSDFKYRAFISYSRDDRELVDDLYRRLTKWRASGSLLKRESRIGPTPRSLKVYLDRKSQESGGALSSGLREKLEQSAFLIVVCSSASVDPKCWVTREIEHFLKVASADRIIPVIVRDALDQPLSEVLPPPLLAMGEDAPIGSDLLQDGGIVPVTHKVIGGLTGFSQDDIAREQHKADQRNRRRIQVTYALAALSVGLSLGAIGILKQRDEAAYYRSSFMTDKADEAVEAGIYDLALLFALEGANSGKGILMPPPDDSLVYDTIPNLIAQNPTSLVLHSSDNSRSLSSLSVDGALVSVMREDGSVDVTEVDTGKHRFSLPPISSPLMTTISPDGRFLARSAQGLVEIVDATNGEKRFDFSVGFLSPALLFSENGENIFAAERGSFYYRGWSLENGEPLSALPAGRIVATDGFARRALVATPAGVINVIDLNTAINEGPLGDLDEAATKTNADGTSLVPIIISNERQLIGETRFGQSGHREIGKISNFGGASRIIRPFVEAQLSNPDARYFMNGDTVVEYRVPSAANPNNQTRPNFTIFNIAERRVLRRINGVAANVSQSGEMVFYVDASDCELKAYFISDEITRTIRPQQNGCDGGYFLSLPFAISADERFAIVTFTDGIFLLNLEGVRDDRFPSPVPLLHSPNERVIDASFDIESNVAYTFTDDGVRLWQPETGDPLGRINGQTQAVDGSGLRIVTTGEDRAVRVSDLSRLPLFETYPGAAFTSQLGKRALMVDSVNIDRFAPYILDFNSGVRVAELAKSFDKRIAHANLTKNGGLVATLTMDETGVRDAFIELWDGETGAARSIAPGAPARIDFPVGVSDFMLHEESASVFALGTDQVWYAFDLTTGSERWRNVSFIGYQPFGQTENLDLILLGAIDGRNALLWSPSENRVVLTLPPNIQAVASTPNNSLVAVSSGNAIALHRRQPNGQYFQAGIYSEHNAQITSLRISKSGERVLSASADRTVHHWDSSTGQKLREFLEPEYAVTSATFSSHEDRIITTSASGFVRVWDAESGAEIAALLVESPNAPYSWAARLAADDREIIVSTIRSSRRWRLPPRYANINETVRAACEALPKGASLSGGYVRERYKLRSSKGENGNPCEHYGLLHWRYYRNAWCSTVGNGCANNDYLSKRGRQSKPQQN
jgi:WD40 repeat protein